MIIFDKIKEEIMDDPMNESYTVRGIPPLFKASIDARIAIVGQAPGRKAEETRLFWNDPSGDRLREWMGLSRKQFYKTNRIAQLPMDFYYPGKAKSGDMPPRKGFAEKWHPRLLEEMPNIKTIFLIGSYAQKYYLGKKREDMKSIGRSTTLSHDITDIEYAKEILMELSDDIGMTARKKGKKGHTVQITIKYSNFKTITRQMSINPTCNIKDIYAAGVKLLESNWTKEPVRLLGISLSGFQKDSEQISLFNLLDTNEIKSHDKIDNLEDTILKIRKKYGAEIIKPGISYKKTSEH